MYKDLITMEVVRNGLVSIAEQMSITMVRTGFSQSIKEARDCSAALFDKRGRLIAEAANVPIHLNCMGITLKTILAERYAPDELEDGDVILTNDPYIGSHHLPDISLFQPIIHDGRLTAFSAMMAHHIDVGGMAPGSYSNDAFEIYQEGIRIPPVKICRGGRLDDEILNILLNNTRDPWRVRGDLMGQISGCRIGQVGMTKLFEKYGPENLVTCFEDLMNYSERRTKFEIEKIPNGQYEFDDYVDDDGAVGGPYKITVVVNVEKGDVIIDFEGSDPQVKGPINAPLSATSSAVYYTMKALTDPTIPSNEGCLRPITIKAPNGSIVNCTPPAAVVGRMVTCHRIVDVIMGALSKVIPMKVMAASYGCSIIFNMWGHHPEKETLARVGCVEAGGHGAHPTRDGEDVTACHVTNCPMPSVEAVESEYGYLALIEQYELRPDSGGPGQFRGGLGAVRKIRALRDALLVTQSDRHIKPPYGLFGGMPGSPTRMIVKSHTNGERSLSSKETMVPLKEGDIISVYTAGGGGYGDPKSRDPEHVLRDVLDDKISIKSSSEIYGVILDPNTHMIYADATEKRRKVKK